MSPSIGWTATNDVLIRVSRERWQLDARSLQEIDRYWDEVSRDRPHFFRGPVLTVLEVGEHPSGQVRVETRFTDFAHFLYSRRYLEPAHALHVKIVTACAWVLTADGFAILGLTHPESSKPNVIQPIGGAPSYVDVRQGYFDPVSAASRELAEETGLRPSPGNVRGFTTLANGSIAVAVRFDVPASWPETSARVDRHLRQSTERELLEIHALAPGASLDSYHGYPVLQSVRDFLTAPELAT